MFESPMRHKKDSGKKDIRSPIKNANIVPAFVSMAQSHKEIRNDINERIDVDGMSSETTPMDVNHTVDY